MSANSDIAGIVSNQEESMNWLEFLDAVFEGDSEVIDFVQRLIGYAASGDKSLELIPVLYGHGRNGKSTFFEALQSALKERVISGVPCVFNPIRSVSGPSPDIYAMRKASMIVFTSDNLSRKGGLGLLDCLKVLAGKMVTLIARPLYGKEPVTFRNAATPFFVVNEIPRVFWKHPALAAQAVVVKFPARFFPGDPTVLMQLREDLASIRQWVAEGLRLWREEGLTIPDRFRIPAIPKRRAA